VAKPPKRQAKASAPSVRERDREHRLSEQDILDRALRLIRADGVESLSMRKLALTLGVAPMSLYHYVRNKDELLARVVDALLARVPTPPAKREGWQDQLRESGMTVLDQLLWHPGIARIVIEKPPTVESRRLTRYTASVLLAAGFDERHAALCLATYHTVLFGVLAAYAQLANVSAIVCTEGETSTRAREVSAQLIGLGFREWSQFGVDSVLSALDLQLKSALAAKRRTRAQPARPTKRAAAAIT
jgi:AcrR family transcriptional regulator